MIRLVVFNCVVGFDDQQSFSLGLEEEIGRLREERDRLDQERVGALETGRKAGEESKNKSRELAGKSRFALFGHAVFFSSCLY